MRYGFDYITSGSYAGDWSELYFPVDTTVTLTTTKGDSVTTTFTEGTSIVGTYVGINISSGGIIAYRRSDSAPRYLLLPQATAAYSLRGIDGYTGSVVRVRKDSNNDEQDFTAAQLTNGDLAAFCTGANGFVVTWYDQSGNGNDATQATAGNQPKIYDSSTGVVLENGKPAFDFGTISENKCLSLNTSSTTKFITVVHNVTYKSTKNQVLLALSNSNYIIIASSDGGKLKYVNSDDNMISTTNVGTFQLSTIDINDGKLYTNSLEEDSVTTASGATTRYVIGNYTTTAGNELEGYVSELIIFDSDQSANRTAIESNINSHYNIYP